MIIDSGIGERIQSMNLSILCWEEARRARAEYTPAELDMREYDILTECHMLYAKLIDKSLWEGTPDAETTQAALGAFARAIQSTVTRKYRVNILELSERFSIFLEKKKRQKAEAHTA